MLYIVEYSLFFIFRAILFPLLFFIPLFLEEKGITGWRVGVLMGEASVVGLLLSFPSGILNDRVESKFLIIISLFLAGFFLIFFSYINSFILLIFLFMIFGVSRNLFQISFDSIFFKQIIRGQGSVQIGNYFLIFSIAVVIGFSFVVAFSNSRSFEELYFLAGIIYLISISLAWNLNLSGTERISVSEYKEDIKGGAFYFMAFVIFLFALHWGAEDTCYSLFLKHYLLLSKPLSALYMASEFVTFGASAYIIGILKDKYRLNLIWLFLSGIFISGLSLILKVNVNFAISISMRMLHGIGDGIVMVVIYYAISRKFNVKRIGGNLSIIIIILMSGSFFGSLIFSRIGKLYGYHFSFIISGIILLFLSFVLGCYQVFLKWNISNVELSSKFE